MTEHIDIGSIAEEGRGFSEIRERIEKDLTSFQDKIGHTGICWLNISSRREDKDKGEKVARLSLYSRDWKTIAVINLLGEAYRFWDNAYSLIRKNLDNN